MHYFVKIFILQNLLQPVLLQQLIPGIRLGETTSTIIGEHGYEVTTINITTEDGYKFQMFHMPAARSCQTNEIKEPVLLMHGLLECSDSWVLNGPNDALGFLLTDNCHPVYLGNSRSNIYGREHRTLSTLDPRFWELSYQDIGYYDLAAMLQYIRATHNNSSINYVGHSQGGSALLVLLSERPEYNEWIKTSYLLAPATYLHDVEIPDILGIPLGCTPLVPFNFPDPLPRSPLFQLQGQQLCFDDDNDVCLQIPVFPFESENVNKSLAPLVFYNHPAGISMNEIKHLLQGFCREKYDFKKFNYGVVRNLITYGSRDPPPFAIENITSRVIIYYGDKDGLSVPSGVERICAENPSWTCILVENYAHLDFLWALNVREVINEPMISDMNS